MEKTAENSQDIMNKAINDAGGIQNLIEVMGLGLLAPSLIGGSYGFMKSKKGKGLHGLASGALKGNLGLLGGLLGGTGGALAGIPGSALTNSNIPFGLSTLLGTGAGAYGGVKVSDKLYDAITGENSEEIYGD